MLRLVHSGTPQAPRRGAGWLQGAAVVQLLVGALWAVRVGQELAWLGYAPRAARFGVVVLAALALALLVGGVFLLRLHRWAWALSLLLAALSIGTGFLERAPAPILFGLVVLFGLIAGRSAVSRP